MKKRIRMLLPILVILAMLVSMFGVATPVMASMILVTKDVTDSFVVNIYYVGDTIYYHMTVENPGNNTQTNTLTRIWDTMPNGTVIEFLNTTAHETLVQAPGDVKDCFTTYVVNASDIQWIVPTDPNVASYWGVKNRFEAEGYDSAHDDVYGRVNKNSQVIRPKLSIEKTVDFNGDGVYSDLETNLAESTASWNVTVCNSGYDPVYDITVTDTNGYDFGAAFNLSVGECKTFTYDKVMNVSAVNNATAEGFDVLGNPVGPVSDDAQVVVVDARITISPSATNKVGDSHNFTGFVEKNDGTGWVAASGVSVTGNISGVGSITSTNPANTDGSGHMTITITSSDPGTSTVQASATVNVGGINIDVATNGYGAHDIANVKTWADARISIVESGTNPVNTAHNFTVTVESNNGTGWVAASGVTVTPSLTGVGSITSVGPYITNASGQVIITVNSAVVGTATVDASATVKVGGININVATNGYGAYIVHNQKTWIGQCTGCLQICKFEDKNGNGVRDTGCNSESWLSGWTFNVTDSQGNWQLVTTGGSGGTCCGGCGSCGCAGNYCKTICGLAPGNYTVTEISQAGWICTTGNPRTVTVECNKTKTVQFGNKKLCTGCLKIYKYNDKNGNGKKDWLEPYLSGWTFTVTDSNGNSWSGTTGTGGYVTFSNLLPGQYTVTETPKTGWTNTDPANGSGIKTVTVSCGTTQTVSFGNKKKTCLC